MGKLTVVSPVHIGSGDKYENFLIHHNKRYSFEDILTVSMKKNPERLLDPSFLKSLSQLSRTNSGDAKDLIKRYISLTDEEMKSLQPMYSISMNINQSELNTKSIAEFMKTTNRMLIPGSSLKGYVLNVVLYDIMYECKDIREYVQNQLLKAMEESHHNPKNIYRAYAYKDLERMFLNIMLSTNRQLIFRDIILDETPSIFLMSRKTKTGCLPQIVEMIDNNATFKCEIYVDLQSNIQTQTTGMEKRIFDEILHRFKNLKSEFYDMNKYFILNEIEQIRHFLERSWVENDNSPNKVNINLVELQLKQIENRVNSGETIIRLGKYTTYILKSMSQSFDESFYKDYFTFFFSPDDKATPFSIGSLNFISRIQDKQLTTIPGYMKLDW